MERPTEWAIERSLPDGRAAFHSAYRESYAVGAGSVKHTHFHDLKIQKKKILILY